MCYICVVCVCWRLEWSGCHLCCVRFVFVCGVYFVSVMCTVWGDVVLCVWCVVRVV